MQQPKYFTIVLMDTNDSIYEEINNIINIYVRLYL